MSFAASAPALPAWHPNFRNYEKLPDIKVVRTAFFVNALAILVTLSLLTYLGFREYNVHILKQQIADVQAQIDRDKKTSDEAIALFKKFQAEEAKTLEVNNFVTAKPNVSVLLLRLAQTLPKNVAIDNLDLRDAGLTMRLSVRGDPAAASGSAAAYLEQLRADKELSQFSSVDFTSTPTPNPATGRMAVEFFFKAKPAGAKK